ncbi:MAG: TIGR03435 family protein [Acidobacteria bacterium]|nr:TIGR03435 family protein [Acidobacteriota bacterium]
MRFIALLGAVGTAQSPPEFEVASVRLNTANDRIVTINVGPGGRFAARGYTPGLLIQRAYGVMGWNISGGPSWVFNDRYDVNATAAVSGNLTETQLRPMLRKLLSDRFGLVTHEGSKEVPGYALVIARKGLSSEVQQAQASGIDPDASFRFTRASLTAEAVSMPDFARYTAGKVGQVAVDATGLKGLYKFKAAWKLGDATPGVDAKDEFRAVVFDAIETQLGLRFAPRRITIRTIVIDRVHRPSEN